MININGTIMRPVDTLLSNKTIFKSFIEKIDRLSYADDLIDSSWPSVIRSMQDNNVKVYGYTAVDCDQSIGLVTAGYIFKYRLTMLGIDFTDKGKQNYAGIISAESAESLLSQVIDPDAKQIFVVDDQALNFQNFENQLVK